MFRLYPGNVPQEMIFTNEPSLYLCSLSLYTVTLAFSLEKYLANQTSWICHSACPRASNANRHSADAAVPCNLKQTGNANGKNSFFEPETMLHRNKKKQITYKMSSPLIWVVVRDWTNKDKNLFEPVWRSEIQSCLTAKINRTPNTSGMKWWAEWL